MKTRTTHGAIAARTRNAAGLAALTLAPGLALADPPTDPPPCNVTLGAVFCIRLTDQVQVAGDDDRYRFMFEILNWTGTDAWALNVSLNVGGVVVGDAPEISGADIDPNGRIFGPASIPPVGNLAIPNDWDVISVSSTSAQFGIPFLSPGTPIAHPSAFGFDGLLDPDLGDASQGLCEKALLEMIPGSVISNLASPPVIFTPDLETIDDGDNVRDGFILEIDNLDPGEAFSFNWHLLDMGGNAIGIVDTRGGVMGDQYGFGAFNMARIGNLEGSVNQAPPPLFNLNTGFDPRDDSDPDIDSPLFWAEDEFMFVDEFPINPIPAGRPGQGNYFAVEPGAAVTAAFQNPNDNVFLFGGQKLQSGINLEPGTSGPCSPADLSEPFGVLDLSDVTTFAQAFLQQDPLADLDGNGVFDLQDINLFVELFVRGCP